MNKKILMIDDEINILSGYRRNLNRYFEVLTASNGKQGLQYLKEEGPFAVIVSDYRMPEMDGVQVLARARELAPDTVRIMLSGQADLQSVIEVINDGYIYRFLTKPCSSEKLVNNLNMAVEQYRLICSEKELLCNTLKGSVQLLVEILGVVNPVAFEHTTRIRELVRRIALRMQLVNMWEIELAAMLSRVGCVTVPEYILNKIYQGENLNEDESRVYREYPYISKKLINNIPRLESVAEAIRYQHKNYNGTGYPFNDVKGENIPIIARVLKIANDFDHLLQIYENDQTCCMEIMRQRGQQYDPAILLILEAEIMDVSPGYKLQHVCLTELMPGMILADDIIDKKGKVLIAKSQEITELLIMRLNNYAALQMIKEPIKVLVE